MHRIERVDLDARSGEIPSLAERFFSKTGHDFAGLLAAREGA